MSTVTILGAGAFGTALAVALARGGAAVTLWTRDPDQATRLSAARQNRDRLPGVDLPESVSVTAEIGTIPAEGPVLLALPMQQLAGFLAAQPGLDGRVLVACCKGIDLATLEGPASVIRRTCASATPAILTGPSFAADIARGMPTALTLACADVARGEALQRGLSTPVLRLYRTTDVTGAELGGALKNVIAIAAGVVIGAGFGDSARAALMTRGYAEMTRMAEALGARAETLAGLSGFGDLVLTCTSSQSRNFRFGEALGRRGTFDPAVTVEGAATARAVAKLAAQRGFEMPITRMIAALLDRETSIEEAAESLLTRPLKQE
ncbi:glycerol-3-phosphate dehydrogenase [Defluviimonas sp. 20V17]|uniref:Glycerol-3-phosphate dehydrogenase [NAD(P)+] n=1 Tax=Allgaiera indica TaxID=765699 RepID=A0AAN4ZXN6_9RHOB|nr:NAD(P)H-dependent glycerol-3-phosphate dehydrogenase [Allgaiera indica]KDB03598.1 glycerol-3-phosphate dehydrogenase [Defluviimonas sp. 20V17]GHD98314.1 glycerol-3-phosphate dehydrogenase [NAD(P)+] [Allgaiera indica]SDW49662.1 glycerol-3-phosphate dehydrogenase (NAD(P)+) [Allgaiera indica]